MTVKKIKYKVRRKKIKRPPRALDEVRAWRRRMAALNAAGIPIPMSRIARTRARILTEAGDAILTESGDELVTEDY